MKIIFTDECVEVVEKSKEYKYIDLNANSLFSLINDIINSDTKNDLTLNSEKPLAKKMYEIFSIEFKNENIY